MAVGNGKVMDTLNKAFNEIADVLQKHSVEMFAGPTGSGPILAKQGLALLWHEGKRVQKPVDGPPATYDDFIAYQYGVNKQKEHDYDRAFTRGLVEHGRAIWAWEVHKKLNRIRTWLRRGTLLVTGEGVGNAVGDAFNYTILYRAYEEAVEKGIDPLEADNVENFARIAAGANPRRVVGFLRAQGLVAYDEHQLRAVLIEYMGGERCGRYSRT